MAHLSNRPDYRGLNVYIRLDGYGNMIIDSMVFRKTQPKMGIWRQLVPINFCCSGAGDSIIIVQNNSTNALNPGATIATFSTEDGRINWSGDIAQSGGIMAFTIPGGIDETFTLTVASAGSDDIDVTTSTSTGAGTISVASPALLTSSALSTTFTTTATPNSQYLVVLSDD